MPHYARKSIETLDQNIQTPYSAILDHSNYVHGAFSHSHNPILCRSSSIIEGNSWPNCTKPLVNTAFLKFFSDAKKSMHLFFNSRQLYISAQAKIPVTVSTETPSHNFCAHISLSRSNANRSAVANRCCTISEGESPSLSAPGKASV
jgi:hypothetical protein